MADPARNTPEKQERHGGPAPLGRMDLTDRFRSMRDEMDRLFNSLTRGFGFPTAQRLMDAEPLFGASVTMPAPAIDVIEDEGGFQISAELPGMDEKDVELAIENNMLTIRGEKRQATEEKKQDYYLTERSYGSFKRSFQLPETVDQDKIEATFNKGVLTVALPKKPETATNRKKIDVRSN